MSSITFIDRTGESVELDGPERFYAWGLCARLLLTALDIDDHLSSIDILRWKTALPDGHYLQSSRDAAFPSSLSTYLRTTGDLLPYKDTKGVYASTLALNTALVLGGDPMKLLARLHGQSEVHCWTKGENRDWLSEIVAEGRESGLFRQTVGWDRVYEFLKRRNDSPVVCFASVADSFPCRSYIQWQAGEPEDSYDRDEFWFDLSFEERWDRSFPGLNAIPGKLEFAPETWKTFEFGSGLNGFDYLRWLYSLPIKKEGAFL